LNSFISFFIKREHPSVYKGNIVIDSIGRSDLRYNGCKINTQSEIKDKIFHSSDIEEP
jgi:uncharacterized lipoprotein YehR (DUF1307 family)